MVTTIFVFLCSLLHADLDDYLNERWHYLTPSGTAIYEGYVTPAQKDVFIAALAQDPSIRRIAEVGFNAGHTSEIFLENARESQVVSFDINTHAYTPVGVEFMHRQYQDRFQFVEGDSRVAIPHYAKTHSGETFDLIYIDGCHLFEFCMDDILNFRPLAHENTHLWIDDVNFPDVRKAVDLAERLKIIRVEKWESRMDENGVRAWVEARYR